MSAESTGRPLFVVEMRDHDDPRALGDRSVDCHIDQPIVADHALVVRVVTDQQRGDRITIEQVDDAESLDGMSGFSGGAELGQLVREQFSCTGTGIDDDRIGDLGEVLVDVVGRVVLGPRHREGLRE